eukprot:m.377020 g.377020  ORF g.377020 m.377020 type:complete len:87 (-) comp16705_c1_seq2:1351-1611(-)
MDLNVEMISKANHPRPPQKPKMKEIFILSSKSIPERMKPTDKQLEKETVTQLKKMAKRKGVRTKVAGKMHITVGGVGMGGLLRLLY